MHVLVTGAAGFIGAHLARRLLDGGHLVTGVDSLSEYYSAGLKRDRLTFLVGPAMSFCQMDLAEKGALENLFAERRFDGVVHLAAQAGVRYSLENPDSYVQSNLVAFVNLLECCRRYPPRHLVYASSSSVYGLNTKMPFSVRDSADHPVSLYAATKRSNELMAHAYSHLFGLPATALRFFTAYGPWGRPDMALFKFTKAILGGSPIELYNDGRMARDFTYIDDIVDGVVKVLQQAPVFDPAWRGDAPSPGSSSAPHRIYNIGNNCAVSLEEFVSTLEEVLGKKALRRHFPMQAGDVAATYADISDLESAVGFSPVTSLKDGIRRFVDWYRDYYKV